MDLIKKAAVIFFLLIILLFISYDITAAFTADLSKFIRNNKEIRLKIFNNLNNLEIVAVEDIEIIDFLYDNHIYKLDRDKSYNISDKKKSKEWYIQIFASLAQEKSQEIMIELKNIEEMSKSMRIVEENELFKIQSGPYQKKEDAEKEAKILRGKDWNTWIRGYSRQNSGDIFVYQEGEYIFSAKSLIINGPLVINDNLYPGRFELNFSENGFDIYNVIKLEELLPCLLAESIKSENETLLRAAAVIIRTNILNNVLKSKKDDYLILPEYRGKSKSNYHHIRAIRDTGGEIIDVDEELNLDISLLQSYYNSSLKYEDLLAKLFNNSKLVRLSEEIEEELSVDAIIEWGLKYQEIRQLSWWGPRLITILDLDLSNPNFQVETYLAGDRLAGLEDLQETVLAKRALAGVNGGYFHYSGQPLGLLLVDGIPVSEPLKNRSSLAITASGEILFSQLEWQLFLEKTNSDFKINIDGLNRKVKVEETIMFNKFYGEYAPALKTGFKEIIVNNKKIISINTGNENISKIPEDGFIIQLVDNAALFKMGDKIDYSINYSADWSNKNILYALGAGPTLIKDGNIYITGKEEEFQNDILYGRAPRTALGISSDSHLKIFTIDGRQAELSIGMTLEEMAKYILDNDIIEAINLDGGGSARMVVRGFTVSNPSTKRLISNGILIK